MPSDEQTLSSEKNTSASVFETIARQAPLGVIVIQDEKVLYANEELAQLIGYSLKDIRKMTADDFLTFVADADKIEASRRLKSAVAGDVKTKFYSLSVKDKHGKPRWLQILPRLITVDEKPAILAMVIDATEPKRIAR